MCVLFCSVLCVCVWYYFKAVVDILLGWREVFPLYILNCWLCPCLFFEPDRHLKWATARKTNKEKAGKQKTILILKKNKQKQKAQVKTKKKISFYFYLVSFEKKEKTVTVIVRGLLELVFQLGPTQTGHNSNPLSPKKTTSQLIFFVLFFFKKKIKY